MLRKIIPIMAVVAILLTACGAQGTPTLSPEQVSGTAISMASTMVAQTQAAIPTNTPVPPTETASPTPLPTFTALATIEVIQPTATSNSQGSCEGPLNIAEAGPRSDVRFENETGGKVSLSLYLDTNAFGQCGYLVYSLIKNEKLILLLPKGVYFVWATITYANGDTGSATGSFINKVGDHHLFPVLIRKEVVISK
jgi:hypothetical protein